MKPIASVADDVAGMFLKHTDYSTFSELKEARENEASEYVRTKFGEIPCNAPVIDILTAKRQEACCPDPNCNTIRKCRWSGYITQMVVTDKDSKGFPKPEEVVASTYRCPVWKSYCRPKEEAAPTPEKVSGFRG